MIVFVLDHPGKPARRLEIDRFAVPVEALHPGPLRALEPQGRKASNEGGWYHQGLHPGPSRASLPPPDLTELRRKGSTRLTEIYLL